MLSTDRLKELACAAIDEALRNIVAVGGDPDHCAILDNFSWGNTNHADRLGGLVRASYGCRDAALAFRTPFISGKDSTYAWERPKVSDALNEEQREILERRGVLSAGELHRMASKTREGVGADEGKASCHSDVASGERARSFQRQKLDPVSLEPVS